jgi:tRNA A-37 threonylcarbamoyl transferase component Bud32
MVHKVTRPIPNGPADKEHAAGRPGAPRHVVDPEVWNQISELFAKSLELDPEQRQSFLQDLDFSRPDVSPFVHELLADYARDDRFMERPAVDHIRGVAGQTEVTPTRKWGPFSTAQWSFTEVRRRLALTPAFLYAFFLVNIIAFAYYAFAFVLIVTYGNLTIDSGWYDDLTVSGWQIVSATAPASLQLFPGDRILAVNGDTAIATYGGLIAMRKVSPGATYTLRVLRNGRTLDITLINTVRRGGSIRGDIICFLIVSLAFCAAALLVGLLKPKGRVARFAYVALMAEALVLLRVVLGPYEGLLRRLPFTVYRSLLCIDGLHFAVAYHFYCVFFADLGETKRRSYMLRILYSWALLVGLTNFMALGSVGWPLMYTHLFLYVARQLNSPFYFAASMCICILVAGGYRKVQGPQGRNRARWIVFGSLIGILPYALFSLIRFLSDQTGNWLGDAISRIVFRVCVLAAVAIPIATAYAILKHRVFDIHLVIRRGLQYIMLKRVLQVVLLLPALALVVSLIGNSQLTVADALWHNRSSILLIVLFGAVLRFRLPLRRWLDRRFFREAYHRDQILLALVESVKRLSSLEQVAKTVGDRVNSALHPACLFVLYADERAEWLKSAYQSGVSSATLRLSAKSVFVAMLEAYEEGQYLSAIRNSVADTSALDRLESAGVQLIVPMIATSGVVVGLLLLGPKMSDEDYTTHDRKLFAALTGQMAMVYENASLQRRLEDQRRLSYAAQGRLEDRQLWTFRECPQCGCCFDAQFSVCDRDGSDLILSLPMGRVVAERYRLDRLIARGGMGSVYEGRDIVLNRQVAIKIITGPKIGTANWLKRVYREAKAAGRLNHPNIIATYDFGISDAGFAYLVMEFVGGCTLRNIISSGPVEPPIAATWFDQLLEGIDAAHRAGIVHRDLKPENVLIANGQGIASAVKILDFGIAKNLLEGPESGELTVPGAVLGSIQYMSPEQLSGEPVDARSDIFAVGVMIFEILTGRLPFSASTYTERIISMLQSNVSLPAATPSDMCLNKVLQKCLARSPSARYESAAELRLDVVPLMANYIGDARRVPSRSS